MYRFLLPAILVGAACAAEVPYELAGHIVPEERASVSLFSVATPYSVSVLARDDGRFEFKKLPAGAYTLAIFVPARGEARKTVEVGPATADAHHRVSLTLHLKDSDFVFAAVRREHAVSTRQLSIPAKAQAAYEQAQKDLGRNDFDAAVTQLEKAVEMAPQFASAWNNLGTIAYKRRQFDRAEECFREALDQDPQSYEPLVNLGGVLVTEHKLDEALDYNLHAVLTRPGDALANSQLGMTYFEVGNLDLAEKYLERAREIDPTHFSHPQLLLAEIHLRRDERKKAAADLEDFLKHHPDWPQAALMRSEIAKLRSGS